MTRRTSKTRTTPKRGGLVFPRSARAPGLAPTITRERECEACRETHVEVWCVVHKRWELQGTEGSVAHG